MKFEGLYTLCLFCRSMIHNFLWPFNRAEPAEICRLLVCSELTFSHFRRGSYTTSIRAVLYEYLVCFKMLWSYGLSAFGCSTEDSYLRFFSMVLTHGSLAEFSGRSRTACRRLWRVPSGFAGSCWILHPSPSIATLYSILHLIGYESYSILLYFIAPKPWNYSVQPTVLKTYLEYWRPISSATVYGIYTVYYTALLEVQSLSI